MGITEEIKQLETIALILAWESPEIRSMVSDASRDNYVVLVTERTGDESEHGFSPAHDHDIDWWDARRQHITGNYPLTPRQADASIMIAEFMREREVRRSGEA
jgi:hypothetical protein